MIDLCRTSPRSHHCFWLGVIDKGTCSMYRAFIVGLSVVDLSERCIIGVEMRVVHSGSISLMPAGPTKPDTGDLETVAQWMVLLLQHVSNSNTGKALHLVAVQKEVSFFPKSLICQICPLLNIGFRHKKRGISESLTITSTRSSSPHSRINCEAIHELLQQFYTLSPTVSDYYIRSQWHTWVYNCQSKQTPDTGNCIAVIKVPEYYGCSDTKLSCRLLLIPVLSQSRMK